MGHLCYCISYYLRCNILSKYRVNFETKISFDMALNIEEFVQKYNPHAETVNYLHLAAVSGAKPYYEIGVEASRQYSIERNEKLAGTVEFEGSEREIFVPSPDVKGKPIYNQYIDLRKYCQLWAWCFE